MVFEKTERRLYGHDVAEIPSLIRPLVGDTTPDAIVQPVSEEELAEVTTWGARERVPLTPRGKATSGYGGAIPIREGVVVDFYRMSRVVRIGPEGLTAVIQAGVVWEKLEIWAVSCPGAGDVQQFMQSITDQKLPLWSVLFINPRMAEMKNKAAAREHCGHVEEGRAALPVGNSVAARVGERVGGPRPTPL